MYLVIGLAGGIVLALIALLVLSRLSGRVVLDYSGRITRPAYQRVLVATVDEPFTARTLELAVRMAGRKGSIKTLYVTEIPVSRSLEVEAEEETALGLKALEEASLLGASLGKKFLPAFDKTRQGSKAIVEFQRREQSDLVLFDLQPGERLRRTNRKIAEYIQEKAGGTVMIVAGDNHLQY